MLGGGGGFSGATTLRTGDDDVDVVLSDAATNGDRVAVGWQEERVGGPELFYRLSDDGGATFAATKTVDSRDSREMRMDICAGYVWSAYALHTDDADPGEWEIVLEGNDVDGSGFIGALLTDPFEPTVGRFPDVACIGSVRTITAWIDEVDDPGDRVLIRIDPIDPPVKGPPPPPSYEYDLPAGEFSEVAVAGTADRAYAAWVRDNRLRIKRFEIGPGPDSLVTTFPTLVLGEDIQPTGEMHMTAWGSNVALVYASFADTFVRVSTDGGQSFGPRERLLDGLYATEFGTGGTSLDLRGSKILVHGIVVNGGNPFDVQVDQFRFRSSNLGSTWSGTQLGEQGRRMGVHTVVVGDVREVEAWDETFTDAMNQRIRFRRQL